MYALNNINDTISSVCGYRSGYYLTGIEKESNAKQLPPFNTGTLPTRLPLRKEVQKREFRIVYVT